MSHSVSLCIKLRFKDKQLCGHIEARFSLSNYMSGKFKVVVAIYFEDEKYFESLKDVCEIDIFDKPRDITEEEVLQRVPGG